MSPARVLWQLESAEIKIYSDIFFTVQIDQQKLYTARFGAPLKKQKQKKKKLIRVNPGAGCVKFNAIGHLSN